MIKNIKKIDSILKIHNKKNNKNIRKYRFTIDR